MENKFYLDGNILAAIVCAALAMLIPSCANVEKEAIAPQPNVLNVAPIAPAQP